MATEKQEWFLVKKNWQDWLSDLSDVEAGQFFKALYTGELPSGVMGAFVKSHIEEFIRVNEVAEANKKLRSKAGKKGMAKRWGDNDSITEDNVQEQEQVQVQIQAASSKQQVVSTGSKQQLTVNI